MISRTSHILRERVGKRMTAFLLSLLIVLFGAGFETVKACCRSFYQNATAHTIMQAYVVETDPLTTSSTDCCGDEGGCCSATDESETEDEGCIPTLIHCSLDDFTPVHHLSAPPILESTSPIFSPSPSPIGLFSTALRVSVGTYSQPPPPLEGRDTLLRSCILII